VARGWCAIFLRPLIFRGFLFADSCRFWPKVTEKLIEKLFLPHENFTGGDARQIKIAERQSRHLADIARLKRKELHAQIIAEPVLFEAIVMHRWHYIRLRGVYEEG